MRAGRFLVATIDGGGTIPPMMGLARRLVQRGHTVVVLADPTVIAMTNQLIAVVGAQPWGMSADDYLDSPARLLLVGSEVAPAWDADLGAAMRHRGLACTKKPSSEACWTRSGPKAHCSCVTR